MTISDCAIEIRNLDFSYPSEKRAVLHDINISVKAGSCFGLIGPNGAGKSTLLSVLTGILPVQSGEVLINGQLLQRGKNLRQQSSLVPQEYSFYQALTLRENLDCFAGLHGYTGDLKKQRIDFATKVSGLDDLLSRRAADCSGGVRRRLNLAIGLLNLPKILYMDEPTVGIDAQSRHFILESITRLQGEGMTIVYTSHYMEEIQNICDSIAVIDHGKVVVQDSLENILLHAEKIPVSQQSYNAKRLEDYYLSMTRHSLRD